MIPVTLCQICVSLFIPYLLYLILRRIHHFHLFSNLGIPGPKPNYIYGSIRELRFSKGRNLLEVQDAWYKKYGNIYGYFSGSIPVLVIHDLEIIKDILIRSAQKFINRPKMIVNTKPVTHTLVGLRGQRWKDVRSVLTPTFSGSKMRHMSPLMCQSLTETLTILEKMKEKEEFDVLALYQGLTCDVISKCALAMQVNCQKDPNDKFLNSVKGFLAHALNPLVFLAICFPIVGKILGMIINRFAVSGQMTTMICENVIKVLKFRRAEGRGRETGGGASLIDKGGLNTHHQSKYLDVLQLMMDASDFDEKHKQLTDEEIIANAWVFVLGGFETTASALAFSTYLLTMHPEVQEHLFQELQAVFAIDEIPTYDEINSLVYLDQIICEALRLYPPVVTFVVREVEESSLIGSFLIPPNVTLNIPVWQIHHDPNLWPQPYKFDPERFSPANKKTHHSMAWIPFGAGPRNCIGSRFGLLETKLAIARLFRAFKFLPSENTEEQIQLTVPTVVISPKNGIQLRCERRLN